MAIELQNALNQLGADIFELDVTLSNISSNTVSVTGPAISITTDNKLVFLPKGSVAPTNNLDFVSLVKSSDIQPITVADATERKAITDGVNGSTYVIQSNLPNIIWRLIGDDASVDASWIGLPYTTDPDGDVVVSMELADTRLQEVDPYSFSRIGNTPVMGERQFAMRDSTESLPDQMAKVVYCGGGACSVRLSTSTGWFAVRWWDGTVTTHASGSTALKTPSSGWDGASIKTVYAWPCPASGDYNLSGTVSTCLFTSNSPTFVVDANVNSLKNLTQLNLNNTDFSGLKTFPLMDNLVNLISLSINGAFTDYIIPSTLLTIFTLRSPNITRIPTPLEIPNISQTLSLKGDFSGQSIELADYFSQGTITARIVLKDCGLSSVLATGLAFDNSNTIHGVYNLDISNNNLDASALNALYSSLAPEPDPQTGHGGSIVVTGNPGAGSDDPSIATAKGYTVIGT